MADNFLEIRVADCGEYSKNTNGMKVGVYLADQNPHRDRSLGITRMTGCLLSELVNHDSVCLQTVVSKSSYRFIENDVGQRCIPWKTDGTLGRLVSDNFHPMFFPFLMEVDLWFYPKGFISLLGGPRGASVLVVHDTIIQHYADHYPEHRGRLDCLYWLNLLKMSIREASMVLTVSNSAKQQIGDFCDRYRLGSKDIRVCYEASDYESFSMDASAEKDDYVLHLASGEPHKRTEHLLDWWLTLLEEGRDLPELRLVGSLPHGCELRLKGLSGVSVLPRLREGEFVDVIRRARALLLPSEIEGFGLPAIEAYFLGTPVCFVKGTSVDEVLCVETNKGGFLLDDRSSFCVAMEEVLNMERGEVCRIGEGLRSRYSKRNFGLAVIDGFKEALGQSREMEVGDA